MICEYFRPVCVLPVWYFLMAVVLNFDGVQYSIFGFMMIVSCVKEMSAFSQVAKILFVFSSVNFEILDLISGSVICLKTDFFFFLWVQM